MTPLVTRIGLTTLVASAFVAGALFAISCGGGGTVVNAQLSGSAIRWHSIDPNWGFFVSSGQTESDHVLFQPTNASDVILYVVVQGTYGSAGDVPLDLAIHYGGTVVASQSVLLLAEPNDPFSVVLPLEAAEGTSVPSVNAKYDIRFQIFSPTQNVALSVDDVQVLTLEGIESVTGSSNFEP